MKNKELVGGQYSEVVTMETRANRKAACGKKLCARLKKLKTRKDPIEQ